MMNQSMIFSHENKLVILCLKLCHHCSLLTVVCLDPPPSLSSLLLISQDYTLPSPSRTKGPLARGRNTGLLGHHLLLWYGQDMTPWMCTEFVLS